MLLSCLRERECVYVCVSVCVLLRSYSCKIKFVRERGVVRLWEVVGRIRPIPCRRLIPDAIGRSYTDTNTDTGNDVTHSMWHTYITYLAHTIRTFQNITSLCFETYIRYAYAVSSW